MGVGGRRDLHPGVEALGYVNRTTPALLSSTSFASDVLVPSLVSISPPNEARSIVSPTLGAPLDLAVEAPLVLLTTAFLTASAFSTTASWTFSTTVFSPSAFLAFAGAFFFAGGAGAGAAALRFRSSTGMMGKRVASWVAVALMSRGGAEHD